MKKILTLTIPVIFFFAISYIYFSPLLESKEILQHDKTTFIGMSKEIADYRTETGEEALWTNSMFGGMPSYLISTGHPYNLVKYVNGVLNFAKRPASQLFLLLLGAYFLFLAFGSSPFISAIGAIAMAFTSYNFIIIAAGHNTKVIAIAYLPAVLAGIHLAFRGRIYLGAIIASLFLALQLLANHLQITYYTLLIVLIFGLVEFIYTIKEKNYKLFLKAIAFLVVGVVLAVGSNFSSIYTTLEYGKYSIRGKSELTSDAHNKTSGIDKDYATQWSYGIDETLTVLIPNFKGGASGSELSKNSETYKFIKQVQGPQYAAQMIKQMPTYWGDQPFTSGPVYLGAIVIFLFVLGLFILEKRLKWWLVSATLLSIMLSWGHNLNWLTNFFLEYVPGYNKFRAVSMTLVIAQITVPLMAILALKKVFDGEINNQKLVKAFKNSLYIVGGVTLFFAVFPGMFFDFSSQSDQHYIAQGLQAFVDALREDRKTMLRNDAFRSFVFVLLSAGVIYLYIIKKLKLNYTIALLGILILVDLWAVDKRYLNNDNFVTKKQAREPYQMTNADKQILADKDPNFRVLNLTVNTFNDASTSYFHKSIGGYHGAKMRRYQELIDFQISKNNMDVLNMLNTKYFIVPGNNRQPVAQYNPEVLGNAWFVSDYRVVPDADAEIDALSDFNPSVEAVVDQRFEHFVAGKEFTKDTISKIELESYKPNHLVYKASCQNEELAVFSEIYYPKGWNAFIDGNPAEHFRVNYVLRAMVLPQGEHTIEFKFEPQSYYLGNKISLASSAILLIIMFIVFGKEIMLWRKGESKE